MIRVPKMSPNITESEDQRNLMIGRNVTGKGEKRERDHGGSLMTMMEKPKQGKRKMENHGSIGEGVVESHVNASVSL